MLICVYNRQTHTVYVVTLFLNTDLATAIIVLANEKLLHGKNLWQSLGGSVKHVETSLRSFKIHSDVRQPRQDFDYASIGSLLQDSIQQCRIKVNVSPTLNNQNSQKYLLTMYIFHHMQTHHNTVNIKMSATLNKMNWTSKWKNAGERCTIYLSTRTCGKSLAKRQRNSKGLVKIADNYNSLFHSTCEIIPSLDFDISPVE